MIVRLDIVDNDWTESEQILFTFYLVNPDKDKLNALKEMIENRFDADYEFTWDVMFDYIETNFETIDIDSFIINW